MEMTKEQISSLQKIYNILNLNFHFYSNLPNLLRSKSNLEFRRGFFRGLARLTENISYDFLKFMNKLSKKTIDYYDVCLVCDLEYVDEKLVTPKDIKDFFELSNKMFEQTIKGILDKKQEFMNCPIIFKKIEWLIDCIMKQKRMLCKINNILCLDDYSTSHLNWEIDHKIHEHLHLIYDEVKEIRSEIYKII